MLWGEKTTSEIVENNKMIQVDIISYPACSVSYEGDKDVQVDVEKLPFFTQNKSMNKYPKFSRRFVGHSVFLEHLIFLSFNPFEA
jgi:hypothetical protein